MSVCGSGMPSTRRGQWDATLRLECWLGTMVSAMQGDSTAKAPRLTMPREHGFWVMLAAVVLSSAGSSGWQASAVGVALLSGVVAIGVAAFIHKMIRKAEWAQLLSSPVLAVLIAPAELLSGLPTLVVIYSVAAWASLFTASSLTVRAAFARSRKRQATGKAHLLSAVSIALPALATLLLYLAEQEEAMRITIVGTIGMSAMAIWRPTAKRLQATGMALAFVVLTALLAEQLG